MYKSRKKKKKILTNYEAWVKVMNIHFEKQMFYLTKTIFKKNLEFYIFRIKNSRNFLKF